MTSRKIILYAQFIICYLSVFIALLLILPATVHSQGTKSLVRSPECPFIEEETILELTDLKVAGTKVPFDRAFDADDYWLKTVVLRVKNVGHKPIAAIVLIFGLLERTDEELPMYASFDYGLQFVQSKHVASKQARSKLPVLIQPGDETELTAEGCRPYGLREVDRLLAREKQKSVSFSLAAELGRHFRKAEIMSAEVRFTDGSVGHAQLLVRSKCEVK
ncbi:MAG TPA: hypothetical protein VF538_00920 [Pyrinomonadaceae bacterium]|jgi:hypothetical protein